MQRWLLLVVVVLLVGCAGASTAQRKAAPAAASAQAGAPHRVAPDSLYARLGGLPAIQAVVPRFLEHVATDERINSFFALSDLEALKGKLTDFFCSATGGPCAYAGRDMRSAHATLPIGPSHFDALVEDLGRTLDELHVPDREKRELLSALGPLRGEIVNVSAR